MKRHLKLDGIILNSWRIQEFNRGIKIFTPDNGIINAVAFGAFRPKSRLGSLLQPVTSGEFNLYHDPVKKMYKITDYEPFDEYTAIKGDLFKYYSCLLWFEIIMKSHAGGESGEALFRLLSDSMNILENSTGRDSAERLMMQFLLRTVIFFTGPFQLNECGNCGRIMKDSEEAFYSIRDLAFICSSCSNTENTVINPGIKKYIGYSVKQTLEVSIKSGIERGQQKELNSLLYSVVQEYIEEPLVTLKTGREFLL